VQYHPFMLSITNYSSQCSIIPLCQVLQTTVASAVSSLYVKYYKLQRPVQYHPLMSSITNYSGQCSIIPLCQVLQTTAASAVSSPYGQYFKTLLLSVAVFISHYSTVITNITFSPSAQSYSHTVGLHADTQQCLLLLNTDTFAGWVTRSLHHNVTGISFSSLVNHSMICVLMRLNVEQAREVSHAAHDSLFATTEQLQMPHTTVCQFLMQPMTVCLPQLNSHGCHTQLYAGL